jgi:catechol 2,3-dioxygenase-like lactoylglutathione lyase family enzyme
MTALETITLISVPVSDQQAAKEFYTEGLGFTVVADTTFPGGGGQQRWIQLAPPGGGATITLVTWFDDLPPGACKLSLGARDVDRAHAELVERGVKVEHEPRDEFWGRYFSLRDPDGNHWLVTQQREG